MNPNNAGMETSQASGYQPHPAASAPPILEAAAYSSASSEVVKSKAIFGFGIALCFFTIVGLTLGVGIMRIDGRYVDIPLQNLVLCSNLLFFVLSIFATFAANDVQAHKWHLVFVIVFSVLGNLIGFVAAFVGIVVGGTNSGSGCHTEEVQNGRTITTKTTCDYYVDRGLYSFIVGWVVIEMVISVVLCILASRCVCTCCRKSGPRYYVMTSYPGVVATADPLLPIYPDNRHQQPMV